MLIEMRAILKRSIKCPAFAESTLVNSIGNNMAIGRARVKLLH